MKKIGGFLIIFLILFIGMINVNAWTIFFEQDEFNGYVYGDRLNPGEDIPFLLMPEKNDSEILGDFTVTATITYDNNVFEFRDYADHYNYYDVNAQAGKVIVKFSSNALKNLSYLALNFKAKSSITSNVSGKISLEYENNGVLENITETLNVVKPSSNALLSSLSIKEGVLSPSFNSNIFEYSASVNSEYLTIECKKADQYAYCSECDNNFIDMQYILKYGLNNFSIDVTAEDGTKKIYKLAITRIDSRSDDATLKNISLSNGSIDFNKTQKEYNIEVTSDIVKLNAIANHDKAKVEYLNGDIVNLNYGETKTLKIKVTSEKGNTSTYTVNLTRKDTRSDDSTLKSLTLSNGDINFNSAIKEYNVEVTAGSIKISAIANHDKAKLEYPNGTTINLNYGASKTVKIKVTSEKGTVSIYTITLTRKDNRSDDATLKSLVVTNTDIKFNGGFTYTAQVDNNVSKIDIKAIANDSKASIIGAGSKNLNVGNNSFIITVTAENGNIKNYIIVVTRKAKASDDKKDDNVKLSSDNYLESINIKEISFEFDKNSLNYNLFTDYNTQNINLKYVSSSSKATVTMSGDTELEVGLNVITLIVVAETGSIRTYTLNITRRPERLVVKNNKDSILEVINSDDYEDIYVIEKINNKPYRVSSEILTALKETGKSLIYEIVDNNSVIYQVKFIGGELINTDEFHFSVDFNSNNVTQIESLINSKKYLPIMFNIKEDAATILHLYLYNVSHILGEDEIKLYEYDENNKKLNLSSNNMIVEDNSIKLDIDDTSKEYVIASFLSNEIVDNPEPIQESKSYLPIILIGITLIVIGGIGCLIFVKLNNKKKVTKNQFPIDDNVNNQ